MTWTFEDECQEAPILEYELMGSSGLPQCAQAFWDMGFVNEQNFVVVKDIHITTFVFVAHVIITRFFFFVARNT